MYFSIIQQIVQMDPFLWLKHWQLRGDGEIRLVSFPECTRYFGPEDTVAEQVYRGETADIIKRTSCSLVDEIQLLGTSNEFAPLSQGRDLVRGWLADYSESRKLIDLLQASEPRRPSFQANVLSKTRFTKMSTKVGDVVFTHSGTPIRRVRDGTNLSESLTMSSGFLAVIFREDGTQVLENGADVAQVEHMRRHLSPPRLTRWEEDDHATIAPCPSVSVTGFGPLGEATAGRRSWTDPAALLDAERWIKMTPEEREKNYDAFCELVYKKAAECAKLLETYEQRLYGPEKSYIALRDTNALDDAPEDDDDFISVEDAKQMAAPVKTG
jgi:hypothetical protein